MDEVIKLVNAGTEELETPKLVLRRFRDGDARHMFENWASDRSVTEFLTWSAHESVAVTQTVLDDWLSHYGESDFYQWAIVPKDGADSPIGSISGRVKDASVGRIEIGYCIGSAWWRQGYTSEALAELIHFFFERVGANRIEAYHDPENPNSGRVMLKCGMKYEGTLRRWTKSNRGIHDGCYYSILAEEYFTAQERG